MSDSDHANEASTHPVLINPFDGRPRGYNLAYVVAVGIGAWVMVSVGFEGETVWTDWVISLVFCLIALYVPLKLIEYIIDFSVRRRAYYHWELEHAAVIAEIAPRC